MVDRRDALLRQWAAGNSAFLTDEATGHLAMRVVACLGADEMTRLFPLDAERLAFAAIWQLLREHPAVGRRDQAPNGSPSVAHALSVFGAVQEWAVMTGLSPFAAGLSHDAAEALARYEAASLCDRISEEYEIGDRAQVTCWYQAAHREAFRAVMRRPQILSGEDILPEEMLRVAAAAHIARLAREQDAVRMFGEEEIEGVPVVEEAVRWSSRRAIDQQKAQNGILLDRSPR